MGSVPPTLGPPGAGPPRRRERHRSAQPRGEADQAAARIWAHFHLGGPPPSPLPPAPSSPSPSRPSVRAPPQTASSSASWPRAPLDRPQGHDGLSDLTAGLVARVKRAAQAYEEARQEALEAERRQAEAEEALAARAAEEAQADAQAAADSRYVASLVPLEALAGMGGLAEGPRGRLGPLLAEAKVLDWARLAVAAWWRRRSVPWRRSCAPEPSAPGPSSRCPPGRSQPPTGRGTPTCSVTATGLCSRGPSGARQAEGAKALGSTCDHSLNPRSGPAGMWRPLRDMGTGPC